MASTYTLGVFNDNFFKQAVSLLAITAGLPQLQGYAAVVFTLPWLLFSAYAGWFADRFPKRRVVVLAKALEVLAMLAGAVGVLLMSWPLVFLMLFLMALQSTLFSPAMNGSIPEVFPRALVTRANSAIKAATMAAMLLGILTAGLALDAWGPWGVALGVIAVAVVGVLMSLGVPSRPAADPHARFPWTGPIDTVRELLRIVRSDRMLTLALLADCYVWFLGVTQILVINVMGKEQFHVGDAGASYLVGAELIGLAVGGGLAGVVIRGTRWRRMLAPVMAVLALPMLALGLVPLLPSALRAWAAGGLLILAGAPGGLLMVPLESFFQVRPAPQRKGAVIAAANFAAFFAMALAGLAANLLNAYLPPTTSFAVLGAATLAVAGMLVVGVRWSLGKRRGQEPGR